MLQFVYVVIWQPCKHRHSESINERLAIYYQGATAAITANILSISKLTENHLITKNTQYLPHSPSRTYGHQTSLLTFNLTKLLFLADRDYHV